MDYEGQRLSELIFYWIILAVSGVGWVIGYFKQEFIIVFKFWLVSVALSVVVSHYDMFVEGDGANLTCIS
jgi:signal peptidase complex subunit 1